MQPQTINVNLNDCTPVPCECGSEVFDSLTTFRLIPALLTPTGQEQMIMVPCVKCVKCETVWMQDELLNAYKKRERDTLKARIA